MDKTVINFRLSELRKAKHITQGELAEIVGTSFQTISKWENGITMPDITVLPILAAFFEVSIDELLGIKPLKLHLGRDKRRLVYRRNDRCVNVGFGKGFRNFILLCCGNACHY